MTPQEFYKTDNRLYPNPKTKMFEFAEAYHKSEVGAINNYLTNKIKELENDFKVNDLSKYGCGRLDAFKEIEQLLKQ